MEEGKPINLSFRRIFTEIETVIIIIDWWEKMASEFMRSEKER